MVNIINEERFSICCDAPALGGEEEYWERFGDDGQPSWEQEWEDFGECY